MPKDDSGSTPAVLATLEWLRRHGIKAVAVRPGQKAAVSQGYEKEGYETPPTSLWIKNRYDVGARTGTASNGLSDADLDCAEAVFFGPHFLPPTDARFGHAAKPVSHFFHLIEGAPPYSGLKLLDPIEKSMIIELRYDGGNQTVCPGSVHETSRSVVQFWKDFGPQGPDIATTSIEALEKGAKLIGIATLIARHLWHPGSRNTVVNQITGMFYYLKWPIDDVLDLVDKIMLYAGDDDKTRKIAVTSTYKKGERGAKITGATSLKKEYPPILIDRILQWAGAPDLAFMSEYNERFAVVSMEGRFRVVDVQADSDALVLYQREDFLNMFGTDKMITIDDAGKEKRTSKAMVWINSPNRRTYSRVDFLPGDEETGGILNLWPGWALEPKKGKCTAWLCLVREVICNGDADETKYRWLLNWLANLIREPMTKPLTAPVIIGTQGAGKSLMLAYFGRILGTCYMPVTDPEHIYGRFNQHLASCLLLHSEEALYAGDKKHRAIIKSLITDEFRVYEPKNVNAKRVRNYIRVVLTSNEDKAAPVEQGDRRYTIYHLGERRASKKLIKEVIAEMHDGGPAALMHFLLHEFKYDAEQTRINIKDEQFYAARQMNYTPVEAWWEDRLQHGEVLPDLLAWAQWPSGEEGHPWPSEVSSDALWRSCLLYMQDNNLRGQQITQAHLARELDKMAGVRLHRHKRSSYVNIWASEQSSPALVRGANQRPYAVTNMPSLVECREAFNRYIGYKVEWGDSHPAKQDVDKRSNNGGWRPQIVVQPPDLGPGGQPKRDEGDNL